MISLQVRRMALIVRAETGRSIQEIITEVVRAVQSGVVDYQSRACPLCGGKQNVTTSTRASPDHILRFHKCGFCGVTFRSHEKKSIQITDEIEKPIVKKRKRK